MDRTRIYVGGLGEGVTAKDMESTFSSLGKVTRVDLITRPDARCFAFMDFEPVSDKSLARLFANYNGCAWKGGKMKLEKASEHYIDRLKREWEELETASNDRVELNVEKAESSRESKIAAEEKPQLKMFFPKLQKVKSLPFKGTGKHKYSFQRVIVPPLPVHFCDCEEHLETNEVSADAISFHPIDPKGSVSKHELDVMHSVMSKLFAKECGKNDMEENGEEKLPPPSEKRDLKSIQDHELIEQDVQVTDDENFVMNIGTKEKKSLESILKERTEKLPDDLGLKGEKNAKRDSGKNHLLKGHMTGDGSTLETVINNDKTKLKCGSRDLELQNSQSGEKKSDPSSVQFQDPHELSSRDAEVKESPVTVDSCKGTSWVQKSSWRDLVGDSRSSLFSISHVLPDMELKKPNTLKSCDSAFHGSKKRRKVTPHAEQVCTGTQEVNTQVHESEHEQNHGEEGTLPKNDLIPKMESKNVEPVNEKTDVESKSKTTKPIVVGDSCTFMRNADSQKQWLKAKTAMSSYLKKKSISSSVEGRSGRR